ncbi:thioredoxin family protein [Tenacibaculum aestuariivivum]|uniref:thioredoxin family protein n=1 Tax=Tenacibaculum aestuariivivum TaxID=2006131 RepID=UPI003AB7C3FA
MKKITYILVTLLIISCASVSRKIATKNKQGDLVGIITKQNFQQEPYASNWFNNSYNEYETDKKIINKLKFFIKDVTIRGFVATWCEDSQQILPSFYKILDEANFNYINSEIVAVNHKKKGNGLEKNLNITQIPTFIFYKEGKEIGRFIEHPTLNSTIEKDILKILSNNP